MPFPSYNDLSSFTTAAASELQQFVAYLTGWLQKEHKDDGSHASITADAITLTKNTTTGATGNVTSTGGTLTVTGTGPHQLGGNLRVNQPGTALAATDAAVDLGFEGSISVNDLRQGPGMSCLLGTSRRWDVVAYDDGGPFQNGIRFMDVPHDVVPLEIGMDPIGGSYWVSPGKLSAGIKTITLGTPFYGFTEGKWAALYLQGGVFERLRTTAMGDWTSVPYAAGNFTGSGTISWTVVVGNQQTLAATVVGHTLTYSFLINGTTVAGAGNELHLAFPVGVTSAKTMRGWLLYSDAGAAAVMSICEARPGDTFLRLFKIDGSNWTAGAGTLVHGQWTGEIS